MPVDLAKPIEALPFSTANSNVRVKGIQRSNIDP